MEKVKFGPDVRRKLGQMAVRAADRSLLNMLTGPGHPRDDKTRWT
jgi:hypothetical protein